MSVYEALLSEKEKLDQLYLHELDTVLNLQELLLHHVIPDMVSEFGIDEVGRRNITDWAEDTPSLFRALKRHKFVASFALEDIRQIMLRRLERISLPRTHAAQFLYCLPLTSVDPFGRPIVVIKLTGLPFSSPHLPYILHACMEALRVRLRKLNSKRDVKEPPVLQYIALLDMEGMSFASAGWMEAGSTFTQNVLPAFPSMLAAVFVLNYTWHLSGAWNLAKRLLPPKALSRVFFPSHQELLDYLTPACLPSDFGGLLAPSTQLENPLRTLLKDPAAGAPGSQCSGGADAEPSQRDAGTRLQSEAAEPSSLTAGKSSVPQAPHHSPYYGYPVLRDNPVPTLRHGRRRKRDLLYTLARLFWARWRRPLQAAVAAMTLLTVLVMLRHRTKRVFSTSAQGATAMARLRILFTTRSGVHWPSRRVGGSSDGRPRGRMA